MREISAYLFLISLLLMGIVTPLAIRLGRRLGILDVPGPRKIHQNPIPLSGGWAIFLTVTLVIWGHLLIALAIRNTSYVIYLDDRLRDFVALSPKLIMKVTPIYLGAVGIFVLGLIDDVRKMSARSRLGIQTLMAIALSLLGFHPQLGFLPVWMAALIGIIWIVGITNAFNFLDGLDGLSTGIALVGTIALLTILGISVQPDVIFLLATLAGTLMGFLKFNYHPAKLFLGSSGSLLLGYLMAMLTLQVTYMQGYGENWLMPLLTPVFVLAIPLYDTTSVVLIRLFQKRSIAIGDQSHFHHRLMKAGLSHGQTVGFIILIAFAVALSAVRLVQATLIQSVAILTQILCILSILILAERIAVGLRSSPRDANAGGPGSGLPSSQGTAPSTSQEIQRIGTTKDIESSDTPSPRS